MRRSREIAANELWAGQTEPEALVGSLVPCHVVCSGADCWPSLAVQGEQNRQVGGTSANHLPGRRGQGVGGVLVGPAAAL